LINFYTAAPWLFLAHCANQPLTVKRERTKEVVAKLVEHIQASVSQHMREKNAQTTANRMLARVTAGYWCFPAPAGYRFEKIEGHGKLMVRDEPCASIVKESYEGFASGRLQPRLKSCGSSKAASSGLQPSVRT
jgi:hypothetical protein